MVDPRIESIIIIRDYFSEEINKVDIDTETKIKALETERLGNSTRREEIQNEIDCINQIRNEIINEIEDIQKQNLEIYKINKYSYEIMQALDQANERIVSDDELDEGPLEEKVGVIKTIIKKDCFFIERSYLRNLPSFKIGILISLDYFLLPKIKQMLRFILHKQKPYLISSTSLNCESFDMDTEIVIGMLSMELIKLNSTINQHILKINRKFLCENTKLIELTEIDFNKTSIETFNEFKNLHTLNFYRVKSSQFFDENTKLPYLQNLSLQNCSFNGYMGRKVFYGLVNLKCLDLSCGSFSGISEDSFSGLKNLEDLNLRGNKISDLDCRIFQNCTKLKNLDLSINFIRYLSEENLRGVLSLERLNLNRNEELRIQPRAFKHLSKLKYLSINKTLYREISSNTFEGLFSLEELYFRTGLTNSIQKNAFHECKSLKKLHIISGDLNIHTNGLRGLVNLEIIEAPVSGIRIDHLRDVPNLKQLKCESLLNVDECFIESLINSKIEVIELQETFLTISVCKNLINNMPCLKELECKLKSESNDMLGEQNFKRMNQKTYNFEKMKFSSSDLEQIQKLNIESARSLQSYSLSDCKIESLDTKLLACFTSLKELNLERSSITNLDSFCFSHLVNLESLNLNANKLTCLKENLFYNLKRLQYLCLNNNTIEFIEKGVFSTDLFSLKTLILSSNSLIEIDSDLFCNLVGLIKLALNSNKIANIDCSAFSKIRNLQELKLNSNKIIKFETDTLDCLINLKKLNLSFNKIDECSCLSFLQSMPYLEEFDISDNKLTKMDFKYFNFSKQIKSISLLDNPIEEFLNYESCCLHNWTRVTCRIDGFATFFEYIYDEWEFH